MKEAKAFLRSSICENHLNPSLEAVKERGTLFWELSVIYHLRVEHPILRLFLVASTSRRIDPLTAVSICSFSKCRYYSHLSRKATRKFTSRTRSQSFTSGPARCGKQNSDDYCRPQTTSPFSKGASKDRWRLRVMFTIEPRPECLLPEPKTMNGPSVTNQLPSFRDTFLIATARAIPSHYTRKCVAFEPRGTVR